MRNFISCSSLSITLVFIFLLGLFTIPAFADLPHRIVESETDSFGFVMIVMFFILGGMFAMAGHYSSPRKKMYWTIATVVWMLMLNELGQKTGVIPDPTHWSLP